MTDGTREARFAAQWWADRLATEEPQRTGSAHSEALADYAKTKVAAPSAEQVETFRAHLESAILKMIHRPASCWQDALDAGEPHRGAAYRIVRVDYDPDPTLKEAADVAGIHRLLLPMKTCMWINPGSVRVSHGYKAAPADVPLEAS